jgi:hypothetical protein
MVLIGPNFTFECDEYTNCYQFNITDEQEDFLLSNQEKQITLDELRTLVGRPFYTEKKYFSYTVEDN